ncbi:hypothetical protein [Prosthecobacter dejongeii]|nr:hypothetical protein [Prosthecobacter dejongeii]
METALRNMQLSLTAAPNPFYEEISFDIPQAFATSLFEQLAPADRNIVIQAGDAYRAAA